MTEAATRHKDVTLEVQVRITIKDPDVIERITGPEGDEWRAGLYDLHTEDDVLGHLAYNCVANGATRANQLDGWADMERDAATMEVVTAVF